MKDVTILTVNFNTPRFIELCLRSIFKNTTCSYSIIVVDNGSTDSSLAYLKTVQSSGKIRLVQRNSQLAGVEHGRALDQVLYKSNLVKTPLVCIMDSDAFAAKNGWLEEIDKWRGDAFGAGYSHFVNPKYLHPACMLIDYKKLGKIGKPSFQLTTINNVFYDTGVVFSMKAIERGEMLVPVKGMSALVPHRWCGTRIKKVAGTGQKLDGHFTSDEYYNTMAEWFNRPDVLAIINQ